LNGEYTSFNSSKKIQLHFFPGIRSNKGRYQISHYSITGYWDFEYKELSRNQFCITPDSRVFRRGKQTENQRERERERERKEKKSQDCA
jgi:hypothetical protein